MKIGQLARTAEVSIDTVRFYERRGVLPRPQRQLSGYRTYDETTIERIRLARSLQRLGLTLDEVIDALRAHDRGDATCATERWRLETVLERIDGRIADLKRVRHDVVGVLAECDAGRCRMVAVQFAQPSNP